MCGIVVVVVIYLSLITLTERQIPLVDLTFKAKVKLLAESHLNLLLVLKCFDKMFQALQVNCESKKEKEEIFFCQSGNLAPAGTIATMHMVHTIVCKTEHNNGCMQQTGT